MLIWASGPFKTYENLLKLNWDLLKDAICGNFSFQMIGKNVKDGWKVTFFRLKVIEKSLNFTRADGSQLGKIVQKIFYNQKIFPTTPQGDTEILI